MATQLDLFRKFIGRNVKDVEAQIEVLAKRHGFKLVGMIFPDGVNAIDYDPYRLNIKVGMSDQVLGFAKG